MKYFTDICAIIIVFIIIIIYFNTCLNFLYILVAFPFFIIKYKNLLYLFILTINIPARYKSLKYHPPQKRTCLLYVKFQSSFRID